MQFFLIVVGGVLGAILVCLVQLLKRVDSFVALQTPRVRTYYAVDIFRVLEAGRELIEGDSAGGYRIHNHPTIELEKADWSNSTWQGQNDSVGASREIIIFEEYLAAFRYAEESSEKLFYSDLAQEVILWMVTGSNKDRVYRWVGNDLRLHTWPTKFSSLVERR